MTDAADYIGKIRSKGLAGTGITEKILAHHHNAEHGRLMIVASVKVAHIGKDIDGGKRQVDYILDDIEVAPDMASEHVRELVRSFYYERQLAADGPDLFDESIEPKVADVIARGDAHKPHPFLPTDAAADNPTCEVCGLGEDSAPHRAYAAKGDPFGRTDDPGDEPPFDEEVGGDEEPALDLEGGEEPESYDDDVPSVMNGGPHRFRPAHPTGRICQDCQGTKRDERHTNTADEA